MAKQPGVYVIGDITSGKSYVGSSVDLQKRLTQHKWMLKNNRHDNVHLQNSYNAKHIFAIFPIPTAPGVDVLAVEQQILDEYGVNGQLLNFAKSVTAPNLGIKPSPETIEKQRIASTGFKHSEETKQRLSEIAKDRGMPREVIEAGAAARRGKSLSPEHVEKVRETSKARMTPEAREHLSSLHKGKPRSPETIAKMKEACKGRTFSPEAKAALQRHREEQQKTKS